MHIKQHFIQKAILNKFSNSKGNNKKVNIIDITKFSLEQVDTRKAMMFENLYDFSYDEGKEVELKLNQQLERPFTNLINDKLNEDVDEVILKRDELMLIKNI